MGSTLASSTPTRSGSPLLEDYDRFFISSFGWVRDQPFAESIGIDVGQEVILLSSPGVRHVEHPLFHRAV